MTPIVIWAVIFVFMVIGIVIVDHIFESDYDDDDDDYEETIIIEQHIDSENNISIGIQNNYYSDK